MKMVTAAILINDGKIFIAKRKSIGQDPERWEFPGGKVEFGETPEQCLKRGMQEEFRMSINVDDLFKESVCEFGQGTMKLMAFRVKWDGGAIVSSVHDDFRWVDVSDLKSYDFAPANNPIIEKLMKEEYGKL
jgi:8-oxo-dGTP diphosphatase